MNIRTIMTAAAALAFASTASAQEVETKAIEAKRIEKGSQSIEPDKGYIFLHAPNRLNGIFIKTPDAADWAEYNEEWEEKFAKEVKNYPGRKKRYDAAMEVKRKTGRGNPGTEPIEPNRGNFSIGEIERRLMVSFGPQFIYDKGEVSFSYLQQVEPGEYTYYGPIFLNPSNGAAMGQCFCMGSVKFKVAAGKVTNLGDFLIMPWFDQANMKPGLEMPEKLGRPARPADYTVPASLAEYDVVRADFRAAGKINNFFGIMINRMPPAEGILAYDRDRVIDVKLRDQMTK